MFKRYKWRILQSSSAINNKMNWAFRSDSYQWTELLINYKSNHIFGTILDYDSKTFKTIDDSKNVSIIHLLPNKSRKDHIILLIIAEANITKGHCVIFV